jgi:hypothetical protein
MATRGSMRLKSAFLSLVLAAGLAGVGSCAHHAEPRVAHREYVPPAHGDWVMLGERWVDGGHDRDIITVGAREGRYRRAMIVVEHSALEMFEVVFTFGDGTRFAPATRHIFSADTRSHVIDLPGSDRVIRSVEFRYGNLPGGGRAQAQLWAQ